MVSNVKIALIILEKFGWKVGNIQTIQKARNRREWRRVVGVTIATVDVDDPYEAGCMKLLKLVDNLIFSL